MLRKISASVLAVAVLLIPGSALAHVIVTPGQAGVGQELTFNVSVPNEQQTAVTTVKLDIPSGMSEVVPTTKDGWTITTDGSDDTVASITWSDGTIPVGQRQDFSFSAQAPAKATDLDWKAYQTYADGTVVHWDQKPAGSDDSSGDAGPYSITHVTNDLTEMTKQKPAAAAKPNLTGPYVLAGLSLLIATLALFTKKR